MPPRSPCSSVLLQMPAALFVSRAVRSILDLRPELGECRHGVGRRYTSPGAPTSDCVGAYIEERRGVLVRQAACALKACERVHGWPLLLIASGSSSSLRAPHSPCSRHGDGRARFRKPFLVACVPPTYGRLPALGSGSEGPALGRGTRAASLCRTSLAGKPPPLVGHLLDDGAALVLQHERRRIVAPDVAASVVVLV